MAREIEGRSLSPNVAPRAPPLEGTVGGTRLRGWDYPSAKCVDTAAREKMLHDSYRTRG